MSARDGLDGRVDKGGCEDAEWNGFFSGCGARSEGLERSLAFGDGSAVSFSEVLRPWLEVKDMKVALEVRGSRRRLTPCRKTLRRQLGQTYGALMVQISDAERQWEIEGCGAELAESFQSWPAIGASAIRTRHNIGPGGPCLAEDRPRR